MAQQLPLALVLFMLGGLPWVVWGIAVRISVSLTGHWLVGHFAHRDGHQGWSVDDVAVQGYNLPHFGLVTFGESFHGNHHAFPDSARLGIEPGQLDLGWYFIRLLEGLGLATAIKLPHLIAPRRGLKRAQRIRNRRRRRRYDPGARNRPLSLIRSGRERHRTSRLKRSGCCSGAKWLTPGSSTNSASGIVLAR